MLRTRGRASVALPAPCPLPWGRGLAASALSPLLGLVWRGIRSPVLARLCHPPPARPRSGYSPSLCLGSPTRARTLRSALRSAGESIAATR